MSGPGATELLGVAESVRDELESLLLEHEKDAEVCVALKRSLVAAAAFLQLGISDDGMAALQELHSSLQRASLALPGGRSLDEELAVVADLRRLALDALVSQKAQIQPSYSAQPFQAGKGGPVLHDAGEVPAPEVIARPVSWDEEPDLRALLAEAETEPANEPAPAPGPSERLQLENLARDAIEDVGILGGLRRFHDDQPWSDAQRFEERLVAEIDALWSLDRPVMPGTPRLGVPAAVWAYVTEWTVPDQGRAFALSFILGCSSSEIALRWVILAMQRADRNVLHAFADGLALASNPAIDRVALSELVATSSPDLAVAWLVVAERRRCFSAGVILPFFTHADARVKLAAIRCLRAAPRELAITVLTRLVDDAEASVATLASVELALRGDPAALGHVRTALAGALADSDTERAHLALSGLALIADARDEARIVEAALALREGPRWLGWYGKPAHVPMLINELEKAREVGPEGHARALASGQAIRRISGLDPTLPPAELRTALAADAQWKTLDRARFGRAFECSGVVAELLDPETRQADRRLLARELELFRTPLREPAKPERRKALADMPRVDVETWVARQRAELSLWMIG